MERRPTAAFVLSLLAGLWMLGTGGMMYGMRMMDGMDFMRDGGFMGGGGSWMWGHGMMRGIAPVWWVPWFGPIAGIIVLIGSTFLYSRPEQSRTWGLIILVVSALNLLVGMGGLAAGTLGVIGGALAISWRPDSPKRE